MANHHNWIVISEKKGIVQLVSKSSMLKPGKLPVGSFLTIEEDKDTKFIIRVIDSNQHETFSPSPMVVDMDLGDFSADQKCQNIISAVRVKNISNRDDGLVDYIRPQLIARKSTQKEVDNALGVDKYSSGTKIFLTSIQDTENKVLMDDKNIHLSTLIKDDVFFHQMMITGKTGSGKTVAIKYLLQHFVEKMKGAVIAINVKDIDLLEMEKATNEITNPIKKEWNSIKGEAHGIKNTTIFYPANTDISHKNINDNICEKITLDVNDIEPESLSGLIQQITDKGAQNLVSIFRFWREKLNGNNFNEFIEYFNSKRDEDREFETLNSRGDTLKTKMHPSTYENVANSLAESSEFFDYEGANPIDIDNIVGESYLSIIDVAVDKGKEFGSLLLRHLLKKIVKYKIENKKTKPVLIIIDEVHSFYDGNASKQALSDLDTICRVGRSQQIGVIFASQNPKDLPPGIESVVNTKLYFRSDELGGSAKNYNLTTEDSLSLKPGYGYGSIYGLPGVKTFKFPMSYAGVIKKGKQDG